MTDELLELGTAGEGAGTPPAPELAPEVDDHQEDELEPAPFLSAEQIEDADDRPVMPVDVPEWGGRVRVRALSLDAYLDIKDAATNADGSENERQLTALILQAALVDEDGEPMFDLAGAERLRGKSSTAVGKVMRAAAAVTGMTPEVQAEAERTFRAGT